jgi:cytochrome c551/c552
MKNIYKAFIKKTALYSLLIAAVTGTSSRVHAQETPKEEDFYKIMKVSSPEGTLLEVGGLTVLPNGNLGVATRRGDIYIVENPASRKPYFRKFASGLHEVLGLAWKDGALYCAQRGELTKLVDTDMDGKADVYETVYAWPLSGHYHEYSFGPKIAPDGSFFVSGNVAFGNQEWWRGESRVPWRGWMMHIFDDGHMEPYATGFRSPCGLGMINGELFYTDNQGDWFGSGGVWQVKQGDFMGHPAGLRWTGEPNSPVKLTAEKFYSFVDEGRPKNEKGNYTKPENKATGPFITEMDAKKNIPELRLPAVVLPHGIQGISNSEIVPIPEGSFGPFAGQLLVGDQGQSKIMRVIMEKVKGEYQGVSIDLRSGFQSGVLRMAWAKDGSTLFVGETNRGWGSAGEANEGLQRLVWNEKMPFEMKTIKAMPDGFEIEFTLPVNRKSAEDLASYKVEGFTYKYHSVYGSPMVNIANCPIRGVKVSEDGLKARIIVDSLRLDYVHNITLEGVREKDYSYSLVHPTGYYTLHNLPDGEKLPLSQASTFNSAKVLGTSTQDTKTGNKAGNKGGNKTDSKTATPAGKGSVVTNAKTLPASTKAAAAATTASTTPTFEEVKPLLTKYTCLACHNATKKQVGPAYVDIAKRKYTAEQILKLLANPKPQNWPDYATEMPPMPQIPRADGLKIANWINSLK